MTRGHPGIEGIIDLERYPIHTKGSDEYGRLVAECKKKLNDYGSVDLTGFVRADVLTDMTAEVAGLPSYNRLEVVRPYGTNIADDAALRTVTADPRHPLNRQFAQDTHAVAADLIPKSSLIRQVYDYQSVTDFIADVLGKERLHHFGDEFQSINLMFMRDNNSRSWHYDGTDAVITLMLQHSNSGGEFEWAPFIRKRADDGSLDENFSAVKKLFDGQYGETMIKSAPAGTLNIFNGLRTMHRVRTVYGPKTRITAVLSYDTSPGTCGSPQKNVCLYGERVKKIYQGRGLLLSEKSRL